MVIHGQAVGDFLVIDIDAQQRRQRRVIGRDGQPDAVPCGELLHSYYPSGELRDHRPLKAWSGDPLAPNPD